MKVVVLQIPDAVLGELTDQAEKLGSTVKDMLENDACRRVSNGVDERIREHYYAGLTDREICAATGLDRQQVAQIRRKYSLRANPKRKALVMQ